MSRAQPPHVKARNALTKAEAYAKDMDLAGVAQQLTRAEKAILMISSRPIYAALAKRYAALIRFSSVRKHPLPWPPTAVRKAPEPGTFKPPKPRWNIPNRGRRSNIAAREALARIPPCEICPITGLPIPPKQQGD